MKKVKTFTPREWTIISAVLLLALFAIGVGTRVISIGQSGIFFNF